jgi:hypothetical protein
MAGIALSEKDLTEGFAGGGRLFMVLISLVLEAQNITV